MEQSIWKIMRPLAACGEAVRDWAWGHMFYSPTLHHVHMCRMDLLDLQEPKSMSPSFRRLHPRRATARGSGKRRVRP